MPIHEYVCNDCAHAFETILRGQHAPRCPACDSASLARQLSVFAVNTNGRPPTAAIQPCGACGDPRGPGACSLN